MLGAYKLDRDKLKYKLAEIKEELGMRGVNEFLNQQGIESKDLDFSISGTFVYDRKKVPWKPNVQFIKVFKLELDKLTTKKDITLDILGLIKLFEKYIGYEDNILYNDKGDYMSQKDIMQLTGLGRKKVSDMINVLTKHKVLFKFPHGEDKRKNIYYGNPNLFYRGGKIDKDVIKFIEDNN